MLGFRAQKTTALQRATRVIRHIDSRTALRSPVVVVRNVSSDAKRSDDGDRVTIGDVSVPIKPRSAIKRPDLIPIDYEDPEYDSQESLQTLRWMMQKHSLKQDIFLIGPPGPQRRRLAMRFCEIAEREAEYLAITRDTTEADLKQRAEVVDKTLHYVDQSPVTCALNGRVLILEGIEKAERNVLPTLNNLLENREMALDDGRFLVASERYDALLKSYTAEEMTRRKLVRVHPDFRVIALGLPVPRFPGYPLDPPLRSRFQAYAVNPLPLIPKLQAMLTTHRSVAESLVTKLVSLRETLRLIENEAPKFSSKMPHFPDAGLNHLINLLNEFPEPIAAQMLSARLIERVFPAQIICDETQVQTVWETMERFGIDKLSNMPKQFAQPVKSADGKTIQQPAEKDAKRANQSLIGAESVTSQPLLVTSIKALDPASVEGSAAVFGNPVEITFQPRSPAAGGAQLENVGMRARGGLSQIASVVFPPVDSAAEPVVHEAGAAGKLFIETSFHRQLLSPLLQDYLVGKDFCLVGPKGCGKSAFIRHLASRLGYQGRIHTIHLFKDMTSRDLLQRRNTDAKGNTVWQTTALVEAALTGGLAVLDGLDRLPPSTLAVLRPLIEDRELTLFEGTRLTRYDRYQHLLKTHTREQLTKMKIFPILPSFRIIAIALPPAAKGSADERRNQGNWLIEETLSLFSFHLMPELPNATKSEILAHLFPTLPKWGLQRLFEFADRLATASDQPSSNLSLSLRQTIRLVRRFVQYPQDLPESLRRTLMVAFMPVAIREAVEGAIGTLVNSSADGKAQPAPAKSSKDDKKPAPLKAEIANGRLSIGSVSYPVVASPQHPELVPNILFYNIQRHMHHLQDMLKDFFVNDRHLLLIGNQGVGKNKLADRLLQLLNLEREYMQLHRDTTVQTLTISPTLVEGVVIYEDSPLVKAVQNGRVLVIDEADKAPLEVVSILKGLVEDGEMTLSDGRRIVSALPTGESASAGLIPMHRDFRVIILANRPGFPFLGNDFFRESGDVFSCHIINNPDPHSEMELLSSYGPDVPDELVRKLVQSFNSLRALVEEGTFSYPYSTRELVNIVKHLQLYPHDGLLNALENVLSFDLYDPQLMANLKDAFQQHGIPLARTGMQRAVVQLAETSPLPAPVPIQLWSSQLSAESTLKPLKCKSTAAKLTGRKWIVEVDAERTSDKWAQGRMDKFTEEKACWKLNLPSGARVAGVAALSDDSVHALTTNPLAIHSFFASSSYRKGSYLSLEDFLPIYEVDENAIHLLSFPGLHQLAVVSPLYGVLVLINPTRDKDAEDEKKAEEDEKNAAIAAATGRKQPEPRKPVVPNVVARPTITVTILPLPTAADSGTSRLASFLDYITPGFRMPRWHPRAGSQETNRANASILSVLPHAGLLTLTLPGGKALLNVDLNSLQPVTAPPPQHAGKTAANPAASSSSQTHSQVQLNIHGVELPLADKVSVERLLSLSPEQWLLETSDSQRFIATSLKDNVLFHPISARSAVSFKSTSLSSPLDSAWPHNPALLPPVSPADDKPSAAAAAAQAVGLPLRNDELTRNDVQTGRARPLDGFMAPRGDSKKPAAVPAPAPPPLLDAVFASRTAAQFTANSPTSPTSQPPLLRIGTGSLFSGRSGVLATVDSILAEVPVPVNKEADATSATSYRLPTALTRSGQVAFSSTWRRPVPGLPADAKNSDQYSETVCVSVVDLRDYTIRHIPLPHDEQALPKLSIDRLSPALSAYTKFNPPVGQSSLLQDNNSFLLRTSPIIGMQEMSKSGDLVTAQANGFIRVWQTDRVALETAVKTWRRLFGITRQFPLRLELKSKPGQPEKEAKGPKEGKIDDKNEPHVGGNTWRGGTGGRDTAGLGGKGGPYRVDAGHNVTQISDEEKARVSEDVKKAAREIAKAELAKRLGQIEMGEGENQVYEQYLDKVSKQIAQLRLILEQVEAKQQEREWLKHQNQGDLDDNKLVDALTGEKLVYRKRGVAPPQAGLPQRLPKRLQFVLDVSGSMYRFNGSDHRLERLMEAALLIMESFAGFEHKYSYTLVGHSGDSPSIPFVQYGAPPKSRKERLKVLQKMFAHSQYCSSGDYTVEAIQHAVKEVASVEADDYFVFAVSDANLSRYGISPDTLAKSMLGTDKVNTYCIFIASLADEASRIMARLPAGHAFFCQETSLLPGMFRSIFSSSGLLNTAGKV